MLSTQQLLNFGDSNLDFLENNLLDQDDWRVNNNIDLLDDFFDHDSGSPSTSSLDSGQGSSTISPISLYNDDIDAWLQDGLIQQQPFSNIIKEEPPSPPAINPTETSPQITFVPEVSIAPVLKTISLQNNLQKNEVNFAMKLPIPRKTVSRTRSTPPLHGKIVNSIPKIPLQKTAPVTSNMVQLNNLSNLPMKSEQLNTALLPGEKYTIPPKIVKLENGQFYIARAVLKNAASKKPTSPTTTSVVAGQKRPSLPLVTTASITKDYSDLKDMKRQERMMKNRESASLSRQRKKDHLHSLELKVSEISAVNSKLQEENEKLKERVQLLESENNKLKDEMQVSSPPPSFISKEKAAKSTTVLLAVIMFIIFNPFIFSSKPTNKASTTLIDKQLNNIPIHFRSRALLQYDNSNNIDNNLFDAPFRRKPLRNSNIFEHNRPSRGDDQHIRFQKKTHNTPSSKKSSNDEIDINHEFLTEDGKLFPHHLDASDCEETFNKTDVNRINRILAGFAKGYKKENHQRKMKNKPIKNNKVRFENCTEPHKHPKPLISPYIFRSKQKKLKKKTSLLTKARERKRPTKEEKPSSEMPFKFVNSTSQELLNEIERNIPRKDDTFYIVSMKDFVILPATNNSQLHRPKFSIIVPSFLKNNNDTALQEFLQIDCNVLDTKVVRMSRKAFSEPFLTRV